MKSEKSTILLGKDTIRRLKTFKTHPRQSYDEVIKIMSKIYLHVQEHNQYDEFLHKIQQQKMQELWDNEEDECWDDV